MTPSSWRRALDVQKAAVVIDDEDVDDEDVDDEDIDEQDVDDEDVYDEDIDDPDVDVDVDVVGVVVVGEDDEVNPSGPARESARARRSRTE